MKQGTTTRKLTELRSRTNQQLHAILRSELEKALETARVNRDAAAHVHRQVQALMQFVELEAAERGHLEERLKALGQAICVRQACA